MLSYAEAAEAADTAPSAPAPGPTPATFAVTGRAQHAVQAVERAPGLVDGFHERTGAEFDVQYQGIG